MDNIADRIVSGLSEAGVDIVYGLPGGETVVFLDALRRHGMRFVLVRHETSAAFMADITARLTKKPAVCLTTLGPGATNAVTGVANAFLDRSSIIVITAQNSANIRSGHTHQIVDLQDLFGPITKASLQVTPNTVDEILEEAISLSVNGRPGPVHLQLTNKVASLPAPTIESRLPLIRTSSKSADDYLEVIAYANALIHNSRKPIVICGLGMEPDGAYEELKRLVENIGSPTVTTPKAKGCIPEDHPLSAGVVGLTKSDPVYELIDEADCVLAIGFDVVELVKPWNHPAPLIWLSNWPNAGPRIAAEIELVGAISDFLDKLTKESNTIDSDWGEARVRLLHTKLLAKKLPIAASNKLLPQQVLNVLRENTPRDTIVASDVGSHKILASLNWQSFTPNSFHLSNGLSSMGYAIPAAIAASITMVDRVVIALVGDGGLQMSMAELSLLTELETTVIVVLFKDGALDLIRSHQIRDGFLPFGTTFPDPDYESVAEAFGLEYFQVHNKASCKLAVKAAIEINQPVIIEVAIDPVGYPTTPASIQQPKSKV